MSACHSASAPALLGRKPSGMVLGMKKPASRKPIIPPPDREKLDVVDQYGNPTGRIVTREAAHRAGFRHRTAHVWLVRESPSSPGRFEVLLQKRSQTQESFPGCYDVSSAGHIPAGEEWLTSAVRELREELGVEASPKDLHFVGKRTISTTGFFHGRKFVNRQISAVYFMWCNRDARAFEINPDEVASVRWMDLELLEKRMRQRSFPHCISATEIAWLREHPAIVSPRKSRKLLFSVECGPAALFDRVRQIVSPFDYRDRLLKLHRRRLGRLVPGIYRMFGDISCDPSAWKLVAAETRRDIGKFVRTHWNIRWRNHWYSLVLDRRGNIHNFRQLPDDAFSVGRVADHGPDYGFAFRGSRKVYHGPDYDFASRVNQALMETTMGCGNTTLAAGLMN